VTGRGLQRSAFSGRGSSPDARVGQHAHEPREVHLRVVHAARAADPRDGRKPEDARKTRDAHDLCPRNPFNFTAT